MPSVVDTLRKVSKVFFPTIFQSIVAALIGAFQKVYNFAVVALGPQSNDSSKHY